MTTDIDVLRLYRDDLRAFGSLIVTLDNETILAIATQLKTRIDDYLARHNPSIHDVLECLASIGLMRRDAGIQALGWLARANFAKDNDQFEYAYQCIHHSIELYLANNDLYGWARTQITHLPIVVHSKGHLLAQALDEAHKACDLFISIGSDEAQMMYVRMCISLGHAAIHTKSYNEALDYFQQPLPIAQERHFHNQHTLLLMNIGNVHVYQSRFDTAAEYYHQALALAQQHHFIRLEILTLSNLGEMEMMRGHPREALTALHHACEVAQQHQNMSELIHAQQFMIRCYTMLNQHQRARDLALIVIAYYAQSQDSINHGLSLVELAKIEIELNRIDQAAAHLQQALLLFQQQQSSHGIGLTALLLGTLEIKQQRINHAEATIRQALDIFIQQRAFLYYAEARHAFGIIAQHKHRYAVAHKAFASTLRLAQRHYIPDLEYKAMLGLGQIAANSADPQRACQWYQRAEDVVTRLQSHLTHTMRSGFFYDKTTSMHALMHYYLTHDDGRAAWQLLEQRKALATLQYLAHPNQLRYPTATQATQHLQYQQRALLDQYHALQEQRIQQSPSSNARETTHVLRDAVQRLAEISERLALISYQQVPTEFIHPPQLEELQASLDGTTALISLYSDHEQIWALCLDHERLSVHSLGALTQLQASQLKQLLESGRTLDPWDARHAARRHQRLNLTRAKLKHAYDQLITPLYHRIQHRKRLVFAPFGVLHDVPFHLLWNGHRYLIQDYEIAYLPCASLIARRGTLASKGALVLAHSHHQRLPNRIREAYEVGRLFDGEVFVDDHASSEVLQRQPVQILHVAAHGKFIHSSINDDVFAFIELSDGRLSAEQALQFNLGYELITLSGCETGRALVTTNDELRGLWSGFFYAGAGAILASQWQVPDAYEFTPTLMHTFYSALHQGRSKAAALQHAYCSMLETTPDAHPAWWGAFQLIGDPSPLST